jgi:DNA-binding response OmpR family regulator
MKNGKNLILCIDDDRDFLDSMRIILEGNGYWIETASSAEEGLRKYKALSPDLVLVDLMMEEVDAGTSFVKEAKALGKTPPIFMLSSVGDSLNVNVDYSSLGLAGVLQKPINPNTLLTTIKAKLKVV